MRSPDDLRKRLLTKTLPPPPTTLPESTTPNPLRQIPSTAPENYAKQKSLPPKPLPEAPDSQDLDPWTLCLWILGFAAWFLGIVVLLPVITERDAMPGFNRWLRRLISWGVSRVWWMKDET
ncbi:hypothetical protein BCR34DRAFT_598433 [Clohesyomyces aquaticus]|uniref:Uncharacterized protein n=1 Tax=Clohesyomyces aquaticus TaxID=1231657 RepID=A0A1Y1ZYX9_9PLEO|nr:hypothetical protein BCR34DRAFT_598433 [Clohesyomyces aquaticus]